MTIDWARWEIVSELAVVVADNLAERGVPLAIAETLTGLLMSRFACQREGPS